ncbi:MAG TPA: SDR family NAD(P)-dependent oxidoreductase [Sphingobium sp.]
MTGKKFEGGVVLVTGGASGIGLATASAFADQGVEVMLADHDAGAAAMRAAQLQHRGARVSSVGVDVRDPDACTRMVERTLKQFGALHIAFNNAGVSTAPSGHFEELDLTDWVRAIDVNLNGIFYAMRAEVPAMKSSGGGAIINTASMMSTKAARGMAGYIASKHGVAGLTKAAAHDLIGDAIRVNAICPGFIDTPMLAPALDHDDTRDAIHAMIPAGRVGLPSEIAAAVLFLASDESSYMVGSLLHVDGGTTIC